MSAGVVEVVCAVLVVLTLGLQWWSRASLGSMDRLVTRQLPSGELAARAVLDAAGLVGVGVEEGRRAGLSPRRRAVVLPASAFSRHSLAGLAIARHAASRAVVLRGSAGFAAWAAAHALARAAGVAFLVLVGLMLAGDESIPNAALAIAAGCAGLGLAAYGAVELLAARHARTAAGADAVPAVLRDDLRQMRRVVLLGAVVVGPLPAVPSPHWPRGFPGAGDGHGPDGSPGYTGIHGSGGGHGGHDGGGGGGYGGGDSGGGGGSW